LLQVHKCIADARSNEIKKLRGVAGDIFELPGKYFANASYDRAAIVDIQKMFGVSGKTQTYKIFPPLLFPSLQEDTTLKTIFGNWTLFAKVRYHSLIIVLLLTSTLLILAYLDPEGLTLWRHLTSSRALWWIED
jgi:hypothetical protein